MDPGVKMLTKSQAEAIAQAAFKKRYANGNFSNEVVDRLILHSEVIDAGWSFLVSVLPEVSTGYGLERDIESGLAVHTVAVTVSRNGDVELKELASVPW